MPSPSMKKKERRYLKTLLPEIREAMVHSGVKERFVQIPKSVDGLGWMYGHFHLVLGLFVTFTVGKEFM